MRGVDQRTMHNEGAGDQSLEKADHSMRGMDRDMRDVG